MVLPKPSIYFFIRVVTCRSGVGVKNEKQIHIHCGLCLYLQVAQLDSEQIVMGLNPTLLTPGPWSSLEHQPFESQHIQTEQQCLERENTFHFLPNEDKLSGALCAATGFIPQHHQAKLARDQRSIHRRKCSLFRSLQSQLKIYSPSYFIQTPTSTNQN